MAEQAFTPFTEYLEDYPEAAELIRKVRHHYALSTTDRWKPGNRLDSLDGYLGRGVDKVAFRVGEHVVKLVHPHAERTFEAQLRPMKKALGIVGVEQLVAFSARETTLVTEYVDGVLPGHLRPRGLARYITPENTTALRATMQEFQERGLYVDSPSNILAARHGEPGFVIIDPLDSPRDAVNDVDALMEDIAQWEQLPGANSFTVRPPEDVAYIRSAFLAASRRS